MPLNGPRRVWRHTVYLGVYELEATYESLHRVFRDDEDAYDERPGGLSARFDDVHMEDRRCQK